MQIVRYRHYPQSDLSAALERLTNMRAEMDRAFESTSSFSGSPVPLSRWNPAVNVYQDKDRFTVVVELPGLKKEEIEISLHDDTLTPSRVNANAKNSASKNSLPKGFTANSSAA
jgi:HSP20 family protein